MGRFSTRHRLHRLLPAVCIVFVIAGCNGAAETTSSSGSGSTNTTDTTDTAAIAINGTPATAVAIGNVYSFQPTATAASGTVGYSILNMPSWATFSTATGQLLGTPTSANVGVYQNIVISVSNGNASAALPAFAVTVSQPGASATSNGPGSATLSWSPPTTNTNGTPLTDLAGFHIYYGTSSSTMTNMVDDETGGADSGTFTVTGLAPGTYYFQISTYSALGVESVLSSPISTTVST